MKNKYLTKLAQTSNNFEASVKRSQTESTMGTNATSANSGLPTSNTVSKAVQGKPRIPTNPMGTQQSGLLNKIAAFITDTDSSLPYRRRVEVAIFKDGKVLLTKNKDKDSGDSWYGFPGGGTEGESDEKAARKECLEEVGVAVDDLQRTDIVHTQEGMGDKKGRDKKYRGSRTAMFTATWKGKDNSLLGDDKDSVRYIWADLEEAKKLLKNNKIDSSYRVKTLSAKKES